LSILADGSVVSKDDRCDEDEHHCGHEELGDGGIRLLLHCFPDSKSVGRWYDFVGRLSINAGDMVSCVGMIEIEKKFRLNEQQEALLINGAVFLGEKVNVDEYFDDSLYSLSRQDHWLRKRNGQWELKVRKHTLGHKRGVTQYEELEDDQSIAAFLELSPTQSLDDSIAEAGYLSFMKLVTTRRSFERGEFHIDLDKVDFGYSLAEIELMVEDGQGEEAAEKIRLFATEIGLDQSSVNGKLLEYLSRYSKDHYQALIDAGVIHKL